MLFLDKTPVLNASLLFLLLLGPAVAQAQTTQTVAYGYDAQGRLTHAVYDAAFTLQYSYDAAGHLLGHRAFEGTPVAAESDAELPTSFALHGNYPNPFNPSTTLRFDLPEAAEVSVEIYDVLGRHVLSLPNENAEAGFGRTREVDASALASGVYLYRITVRGPAGTWKQGGQMVVLK